jgi:SAM-dependent methyltransferase
VEVLGIDRGGGLVAGAADPDECTHGEDDPGGISADRLCCRPHQVHLIRDVCVFEFASELVVGCATAARTRNFPHSAGLISDIGHVGYTTGQESEGFPFPDNTFDAAFLAAVIGEVPDKQACIRSLARVLKPGGRLVFAETFPDPDRLSVEELRDLAESENFEFVEATGNRWHNVVRFRRVDPS